MGIPNRQIGWGTEENLLWQIAGQISRINKIAGNIQSSPTQLVSTGLQANYDASDPLSFYTSVNYTPWRNISPLIGPFTVNTGNLNKIGSPTFSSNPNFLTFNGTNQGYAYSAYPVTPFESEASYGCWFKTTSTATGGSLFSNSPTILYIEGTSDYKAAINFSNGRVGIGSVGDFPYGYYLQYTTNTYNDGQWHYVVFTYNSGGDNIKLYVDGVLQFTAIDKILLGNSNYGISLALGFNAGTWFAGSIAVAQGYSIELTAAQVLQNYNALKDRYI
jgi:hypothetical protein